MVTLPFALRESGWNHFEKRSSLFSLLKQKPLSEIDGKYVLAAESVVIVKIECLQFCRLCHRDMGQSLKWTYQGIRANCSHITNSLLFDPLWAGYAVFVHILISGWEKTEQAMERTVIKPSPSPSHLL